MRLSRRNWPVRPLVLRLVNRNAEQTESREAGSLPQGSSAPEHACASVKRHELVMHGQKQKHLPMAFQDMCIAVSFIDIGTDAPLPRTAPVLLRLA